MNNTVRLCGLANADRERVPLYFSPEVAACAALSVRQLQKLAEGRQPLEAWQVLALARRMDLIEPGVSQSTLPSPVAP